MSKNNAGRIAISNFKLYYSYSNKNNTKKTSRTTKQDRIPKPKYNITTNQYLTEMPKIQLEERHHLQ